MMILLQQVTEGQWIYKLTSWAENVDVGSRQKGARLEDISRARLTASYFAGFRFVGTSTLSTCNSIWVPDSSFMFPVFDTIIGPGVLTLGVVLRLRPLSPKIPCGMPILIGLPVAAVSRRAPELFT
jgi:hypothetical protein